MEREAAEAQARQEQEELERAARESEEAERQRQEEEHRRWVLKLDAILILWYYAILILGRAALCRTGRVGGAVGRGARVDSWALECHSVYAAWCAWTAI